MLAFPNCKINIGLNITNLRADGYHDLETIFYPVHELKDALELIPAKKEAQIYLNGKGISGDEKENLVWKAYKILQQKFPDKIPLLDIYLQKSIPMGAGLGGGSADGAFMLRLINDYCRLNLKKETLAEMALQLGSDCPFFIYNTPQFAMGRGEKMESINLELSAYHIQIICPQVHVSTKEAFGKITPKAASFDLRKLPEIEIQDWKKYVVNDFETPIFQTYPQLKKIKDQFYEQGALYASMSGSGSAVYGIFSKREESGN